MKIGFDLDDVIVEFARGFLVFCNRKLNANLKFEDWVHYNFQESFGLTPGMETQLIEEFYQTPDFEELSLVRGARGGISDLAKKKDLAIVTSRPVKLKKKTDNFIQRFFQESPLKVFYSREFNSSPGLGKAEVCHREGIGVLVEDNLGYAQECSRQGITVYLFSRPWNQNYENGIIRLNNWNQILNEMNYKETED